MFIDIEAANRCSKPRVIVSSRSPARYTEESTPLLETFMGQDASPSYLEATTPIGYGRRGEGVGLLNARRALSTPSREEGHKDGKYRRRSIREHCSRRRMLKWMAVILAIIIIAVIIAAVAHKNQKSKVASNIPVPAQSAESETPKTNLTQDFPIRWPSGCGKDYNIKSEEMMFAKTSELNIVEAVHQLDGPYKRVSGWIHVTQAPTEQAAGTIKAEMSYAVSSSVDTNNIKYSYSPTGLTIGDPTFPDPFDGVRKGSACLGISVVLSMARGATLQNLNIRAIHLGMQIHEGVDFSVTNGTSISLTTGTLDAASFASRETRLETISGSISGKYSLLDLLSITTKSGSVNINVDPKEKAKDGPAAAVFRADSLSGSIRVDTERKQIPERDYIVSINTTVGSIDGTFIHGSNTQIDSLAGSITVDLLPYKSGDYSSVLSTKTTDGQTEVKLRSPYKSAGTAMGKLSSSHTSVSGQVNLTYPPEWEGHLEGQSVSGFLHLQGKELELIRRDERPGLNLVEAKKGSVGSTMVFKTLNGGCDVRVGKIS